MNPLKQFWALLKFQLSINPFILIVPLMFAAPLYFRFFSYSVIKDPTYHPSLDLLLSTQNLFFVGFLGVMWLAPEILQFAGACSMWTIGTEFLITRAIDRPLLYRARVAFFYFLVLMVPFAIFLTALRYPELQISEYHKVSHQLVLSQISGSIPMPPDKNGRSEEIMIPDGNILINSYNLWMFLCAAIGTQTFIFLIYPLKYRRFIFWTAYMGLIFLPLLRLGGIASGKENLSFNENLFFSFTAHQPLFWILLILVTILGQLWGEHRFMRQEQ